MCSPSFEKLHLILMAQLTGVILMQHASQVSMKCKKSVQSARRLTLLSGQTRANKQT